MIAFFAVFGFVALAFTTGIILVRFLPPAEAEVIDLESRRTHRREAGQDENHDASEVHRW